MAMHFVSVLQSGKYNAGRPPSLSTPARASMRPAINVGTPLHYVCAYIVLSPQVVQAAAAQTGPQGIEGAEKRDKCAAAAGNTIR